MAVALLPLLRDIPIEARQQTPGLPAAWPHAMGRCDAILLGLVISAAKSCH